MGRGGCREQSILASGNQDNTSGGCGGSIDRDDCLGREGTGGKVSWGQGTKMMALMVKDGEFVGRAAWRGGTGDKVSRQWATKTVAEEGAFAGRASWVGGHM